MSLWKKVNIFEIFGVRHINQGWTKFGIYKCYQATLASNENHTWTLDTENSTPNVVEELETVKIIS